MTGWNTLDGRPSRIIAHRGASGELPEHTMHAYVRATGEGADVIEPDLVCSRDGVLFARHDLGLQRSTDVAQRPEFAERAREQFGERDWWVDDFSAAELDALRALQPWPQRDQRFNSEYPLARFGEVLEFARLMGARRGRPLPVYPEIKHPAYFRRAGLDPLAPLLACLHQHGLCGAQAPVWLQCLDHEVLREAHASCGNPCFALLEAAPTPAQLAALADWAQGIAPGRELLWDGAGRPTGLVEAAHDIGLEVHAWTFRDDMGAAPFASPAAALEAAFDAGVDALFCDFPASAVAARDAHGR